MNIKASLNDRLYFLKSSTFFKTVYLSAYFNFLKILESMFEFYIYNFENFLKKALYNSQTLSRKSYCLFKFF